METVSFDKVLEYNTLKIGITVLVVLQDGDRTVDFEAKVDTGATIAFLNANTPNG